MPAESDNRRLLFVSPVGFIGGAERVLLECIRQARIRRPDWEITLLQFDEGPLKEAAEKLGVKVEVLGLPNFLSKTGDSKLIRHESRRTVSEVRARSIDSEKLAVEPQGIPPFLKPDERAGNQSGPSGIFRKATSMPAKLVSAWRFYSQLRKFIRRLQPDLIHSNGLKSHMLLSVAQPRNAKVLWHIHDFYSHRPKIQAWIRRLSRRSLGGFAISSAVAKDITSVVPRWPVHLLENCVDTVHFAPGDQECARLDSIAGMPSEFDGLRFGLIATYANWKGHDAFLKALAKVPNVRGYIIGDPIYSTMGSQWSRSQLEELATSLGIRERVGFVSFQADPTWVYRSLDVVVHASVRPEPFGLTIIEAMACGRPVIISDAGGAHDLFTDGHDGIGHIPGDIESLATAFRSLATNDELRRRIAQNARQSAVQRFSTERFGDKLIEVYDASI
jgi:glycosyltransferase involved in cell wall biosynthesis